MYRDLSFSPKFVKVCLLCLASTSALLWSNDRKIIVDDVVSIIPLVEVSRGSPHTIRGDGGLAFGWYQIHQVMVDDYNRISGEAISHEDVFNPKVAKRVCRTVLNHYAKYIESQDVVLTHKHLFFVWNGGGSAWRLAETTAFTPKKRNLERYYSRALPHLLSLKSE